jgi:hypothetical protein
MKIVVNVDSFSSFYHFIRSFFVHITGNVIDHSHTMTSDCMVTCTSEYLVAAAAYPGSAIAADR